MSTKKLSIIITLVIVFLIGSGVVYYKTYTTTKSNVAKIFKTNINKSNSVINKAIKDTEKELSSDSKNTKNSNEAKSVSNNSKSTLAVQNVDYMYTTYIVKKGDTLWSIAANNLPICDTKGVVKDITLKNKLDNSGVVKIGQKLTIPTKK